MQMGRLATAVAALTVAAMAGCGDSSTGPSRALTGQWGGAHVSLAVTNTSSHLEFDCAHGDIPGAVIAGTGGVFAAGGTFVHEHGGPIRDDESPEVRLASYVGTVTLATMRLTVRLTDTGEIVGTFTLVRGALGRVVKCL